MKSSKSRFQSDGIAIINNQGNQSYTESRMNAECSFSWSVASVFEKLKIEIPLYELGGFSLNAFAIWAHPDKTPRFWQEANCDLFTDILLRAVSVRGELITAPDKERDLLEYFLRHLSARVTNILQAGIPVAACDVWSQSLWGIITDWNPDERIIKGFVPGEKQKIKNTSWPRKLLLINGTAVSPRIETSVRVVLRNTAALLVNNLPQNKWASGLDAYVIWRNLVSETYNKDSNEHRGFALYISANRNNAAQFLTHHADFHNTATERTMLALAKRFKTVSLLLHEAASSPGKRPFINALTEAMSQEEKALALLDELLLLIE